MSGRRHVLCWILLFICLCTPSTAEFISCIRSKGKKNTQIFPFFPQINMVETFESQSFNRRIGAAVSDLICVKCNGSVWGNQCQCWAAVISKSEVLIADGSEWCKSHCALFLCVSPAVHLCASLHSLRSFTDTAWLHPPSCQLSLTVKHDPQVYPLWDLQALRHGIMLIVTFLPRDSTASSKNTFEVGMNTQNSVKTIICGRTLACTVRLTGQWLTACVLKPKWSHIVEWLVWTEGRTE